MISTWGVEVLPVDLLRVDLLESTPRAVTQQGFWLALL
jgi:hypothetical protein